jgi:hypothetical protein
MCRRAGFAFVLALGDKDNIGAGRPETLAIFADCSAHVDRSLNFDPIKFSFAAFAMDSRSTVGLEQPRTALVMELQSSSHLLASLAAWDCQRHRDAFSFNCLIKL